MKNFTYVIISSLSLSLTLLLLNIYIYIPIPIILKIEKSLHIEEAIRKMATQNHTISIPKEQEEWLSEHPEVSLSKIVQSNIQEQMESSAISAAQLKEANRKREAFQKLAEDARIFIEKHGLIDEWLKERGFS